MGVTCSSPKADTVAESHGSAVITNIDTEYPHKVIMVGPNGAGKTQLLYSWKVGCQNIIQPLQTEEFNVEQVRLSDDHPLLVVFDLNGSPSFRTRWRQYYQGTEGIVFVVDSSDVELLNEAKQDMVAVLHERDLADVPLLIIANKQDLADSMSLDEIEKALGLRKFIAPRRWEMIGICANNGDDINRALDILTKLVLDEEVTHADTDKSFHSPRQNSREIQDIKMKL